MLFDDDLSLPGADVAAGVRIMWVHKASLIKSVGTTPLQFELTVLQVRPQAL